MFGNSTYTSDAKARTLKFVDNATIYINTGSLKVDTKNPAIAWDEKPENIDTIKFKNADSQSKRTFVIYDDGDQTLLRLSG